MPKKKRRKMRPGGGHAKGSAFERKMARLLSKWWFGKEGYLWRRPGPGTRFFKQPHRHTGDVVPSVDIALPKGGWPFHVELKFWARKSMKLDMLLWPQKNPIRKIWKKAIEEKKEGLIPMLLLKANRMPDLVCVMKRDDFADLTGGRLPQCYVKTKSYIVFSWKELTREFDRSVRP